MDNSIMPTKGKSGIFKIAGFFSALMVLLLSTLITIFHSTTVIKNTIIERQIVTDTLIAKQKELTEIRITTKDEISKISDRDNDRIEAVNRERDGVVRDLAVLTDQWRKKEFEMRTFTHFLADSLWKENLSFRRASDQLIDSLTKALSAKGGIASIHDTIISILWVTDNLTSQNDTVIRALRQPGFRLTQAKSTIAALDSFSYYLRTQKVFDVIITDMGRSENGKNNSAAGLDLMDSLKVYFDYRGEIIIWSTQANCDSTKTAPGSKARIDSAIRKGALLLYYDASDINITAVNLRNEIKRARPIGTTGWQLR